MADEIKWDDTKPTTFKNVIVDGVGYLKLINGIWVAENGDEYEITVTPTINKPSRPA